MPRLGRTLAARILLAVLGIVVVTLAVGFALFARLTSQTADATRHRAGQRHRRDPRPRSPQVARRGRGRRPGPRAAGRSGRRCGPRPARSYVVIIDRDGAALLPPQPGRSSASASRSPSWPSTGTCTRASTRAASAGPPTRGPRSSTPPGRSVGEVSVGILESEVGGRLTAEVLDVALYTGGRPRPRRRGLAPAGPGHQAGDVRPRAGRDRRAACRSARRCCTASARASSPSTPRARSTCSTTRRAGCSASRRAARSAASRTSCPRAGCAGSCTGEVGGADVVAVTDEHLLVLNRMPVLVGGRNVGWVVTIRDRTELEALLRQLDSVEALTDGAAGAGARVLQPAARAVRAARARARSRRPPLQPAAPGRDGPRRRGRSGPASGRPVVAALLLAKTTVAAERDVVVRLDPASRLEAARRRPRARS